MDLTEQQQQQQVQNPIDYDIYFKQEHVQNIIWRLDAAPIINEIEHNLRGEFFDEQRQDYTDRKVIGNKVIISKPLMNEEGIHVIITRLRSILNKINVQGNLDKPERNSHALWIGQEVTDLIDLNHERWNIEEQYWDTIVNMITQSVDLFLSRTIDDKERIGLNNQYKFIEQNSKIEQDDKNRIRFFR